MDKDKYRELCKQEKTIPIFQRDWWMDAVSIDGDWDVKLYETGGEIVGALVYYTTKRAYKKVVTLPPLTQKNGIWIRYPQNQKLVTKIAHENRVIKELLNQLEEEKLYSCNQNFDYRYKNWYEYYWRGYNQTTRYTYVIEDLTDLKKVYDNFDSNLRRNIRNAEKVVEVRRGLDIGEFYELVKETYKRQDMKVPYSMEVMRKVEENCSSRNCREIFYAIDKEGNIHSAIYIVWDDESAYYIIAGSKPEFGNSQATSLLIWKAIEYSASYVKKFDFEGSMMKNIERFFRSYGGTPKEYFSINKIYKYDYIYELLRYFYKKYK